MMECPYSMVDNANGVFDMASYQAAMAMCPPVRISAESEEKVRRLHHAAMGSGEIRLTFDDWQAKTIAAAGLKVARLPGNAASLYTMGIRPEDAANVLDTAHIADLVEARGWPRFIDPEKFDRERLAEVTLSLEHNAILDGALRGVVAADGAENPYTEFTENWHAWNWGFAKRAELREA